MAVPHTCDASALPGGRTTGPEESPDAPRPTDPPSTAADRGRRPLSLFPSRGSPKRAGASSSFPTRTDPHLRDRRARRRRRTSGGDGPRRVRRRAGDDRPPFLQRPRPRERSRARDARTGSPAPRRDGSPLLPDRGNAAGERGSEATPHGTPQRATHTHATRTARPRTRERQRRGSAGGTARGGHGRCGRVGPGSPPPPSPALPARLRAPRRAHHPPRGSGVTGGSRGARARARRGPLRPPTTGNNIPGSGTARRRHGTLSFAPRGSSPDSERGGAGRSGHTNARVPPPKVGTRRGEPGQSYAHRAGHGAGRGDPRRVRRETPSTPFHRIAREGTFLAEGGRDGPGPTSPRPRQPRERGKRRSMISNVARRGGSAVSVRASLYLFPSGGAFSSVTRTGGTGPRKSINYKLGPPRARPLRHHPPALHRTGRHSNRLPLKPTSNGEKNRKAGRDSSTPPHGAQKPTGEGSAWWAARPISQELARDGSSSPAHGGGDGRREPLSYRSPRPPHEHTFAEEHRRRPDRAREGTHVGETGNAAAAQYRAPLKIGLERSRSTARIASETRAHKARSGRACDAAHIGQPSPGSEGGGPHGPHTVGGAKRARGGRRRSP